MERSAGSERARRLAAILEGGSVIAHPVSLSALRERRDEILAIAQSRRAKNIRVYGSVARGEATAASDVDFLVEMEPDATLVDLIGLEQDLAALLGRKVDVATEDGISPLMREDPKATAVRL